VLKRIAVPELRIGMFIDELCGSWMEHPFWRARFALKDAGDVRRIVESGIQEVWIDTDKGVDVEPAAARGATRAQAEAEIESKLQSAAAASVQVVEHPPLTEELERAHAVYVRARPAVLTMFNEARMGQAVSGQAASDLVDDIYRSVQRNAGALIELSRLKRADDYTCMHPVAVCGLMIALGRQLGMDEADIRQAGLAGLLLDIGKAMVPDRILRKPDKLSDDEWARMKSHPELGHAILSRGPIGEIPLDVVLHHHEKLDGTGYPHRLAGGAISVFARMASVCDVYDAVTSNRPYKTGWPPAEAIRKMAEWTPGHYDDRVFQAFVKTVGIYPVGTLVRLECDELGVVVEHNEAALLRPKVMIFYSIPSQSRIAPETIDLSSKNCPHRILGREDASSWGLTRIDDIWAGRPIRL
jgi:HD-GYP domain-containing protein (c-di-GMP phosphodiesterase class II)